MHETFLTIGQKQVKDSDGFLTDYTMYMRIVCNTADWFDFLKSDRAQKGDIPEEFIDGYVFVFGDSDIYDPEDGYFDYECDSEEEAYEWFDSYNGFDDDDEDF